MKKTVLLLGAFALTFLTSQAQFTSSGFTEDFTSDYLINGSDTLGMWGTDESATNGGKPKYAFTRDVANGELDIVLNQPKGSYSDMGFTFGANKTINLNSNSTFNVELRNDGEEIIYVSIFAIDVNNYVIDHETVPVGTAPGDAWKWHLSVALDPGDVKTLPFKLSTSDELINAHGTTIRGMFKNGSWVDYSAGAPQVKQMADITKIKGINLAIRNGLQDTEDSYKPFPLVDYPVSITKITIGDYTIGTSGVEEVNAYKQTLNIYPNPVSNGVVNLASNVEDVKIFDAMGTLVKSFESASQVDVSDLTSGMYFLQTSVGHSKLFINN